MAKAASKCGKCGKEGHYAKTCVGTAINNGKPSAKPKKHARKKSRSPFTPRGRSERPSKHKKLVDGILSALRKQRDEVDAKIKATEEFIKLV